MTWTAENTQGLVALGWIFVLYLLRHNKPFDAIWNLFKIALVIIFVITTAGLAIKWLKKIF